MRNINKNIVTRKDLLRRGMLVELCTDKSNKLAADSVTNYEKALDEHIKDDLRIEMKKVRKIEVEMNNQIRQFNKMFRVGATWGHEDRIAGASTSTNVPPPVKYGLRKDHKHIPRNQEAIGPPIRPICGASEAPNSRFSHFLSMMVCHFAAWFHEV